MFDFLSNHGNANLLWNPNQNSYHLENQLQVWQGWGKKNPYTLLSLFKMLYFNFLTIFLVIFVPLPPAPPKSHLPPLLHRPLSLWREVIDEESHLEQCPSFSVPCPAVGLSTSITITCKKPIRWWFSDELIYGRSNVFLGILSFLCSFRRIIVVVFPSDPWPT